jgi:hypothetical protein
LRIFQPKRLRAAGPPEEVEEEQQQQVVAEVEQDETAAAPINFLLVSFESDVEEIEDST